MWSYYIEQFYSIPENAERQWLRINDNEYFTSFAAAKARLDEYIVFEAYNGNAIKIEDFRIIAMFVSEV